ncbi:unnamed protein product [Rhodiola kirilowii]
MKEGYAITDMRSGDRRIDCDLLISKTTTYKFYIRSTNCWVT